MPDPDADAVTPEPRLEAALPGAELPTEYLRADAELLVDSIGLAEPHDPSNTIET